MESVKCQVRLNKIFATVMFIGIALLSTSMARGAESSGAASKISSADVDELNNLLSTNLNQLLVSASSLRKWRVEKPIYARVDLEAGTLIIDLPKELLPERDHAETEDLRNLLSEEAQEMVRGAVEIRAVKFTYGGRDVSTYIPSKNSQQINELSNVPTPSNPQNPSGQTVVVSAGHGLYFDYRGAGSWRLQRDLFFWNGRGSDNTYFCGQVVTLPILQECHCFSVSSIAIAERSCAEWRCLEKFRGALSSKANASVVTVYLEFKLAKLD